MLKIEKIGDGYGVPEVKRFYLPYRVTSTCPECGEEVTRDLSGDYLSYPSGGETDIDFCHEPDDDDDEGEWFSHEWTEKAFLAVVLTPVPCETQP